MPTEKDIFVNEINAYAKKYGISKIMTKKEVLAIAGLSKKSNISPADYCYNRFNDGLKGFTGPFLFEYNGRNQYVILGEGYNYTGKIIHCPKGGSPYVWTKSWKNGKLV